MDTISIIGCLIALGALGVFVVLCFSSDIGDDF